MKARKTYNTGTEKRIKDALLRLLADKPLPDVSVAELAREANVSRSTFYSHFGNVADVYDALAAEISASLSPLISQIACSDGFRSSGKPLCAFVRDAGEYAAAVNQSRFVDGLLLQHGVHEAHDLYRILVDAGYSEVEARALCSFQMTGCFNAVRSTQADEGEWAEVRAVIDRFILGGIAACLAAKRG